MRTKAFILVIACQHAIGSIIDARTITCQVQVQHACNGSLHQQTIMPMESIKEALTLGMELQSVSLTQLANVALSDKGSVYQSAHQYASLYDHVLQPYRLRNAKFTFMEIGLNKRDRDADEIPSLRMWRTYFGSKVELVGMDIEPFHSRFHDPLRGRHICIGDQSVVADIERCGALVPSLDVVLDDGYHASMHQQLSLLHLWPRLAPGGLYIIEDLHWQPRQSSAETGHKTRDLLLMWANGIPAATNYINTNQARAILAEVENITLFDSLTPQHYMHLFCGDNSNAVAIIRKSGKIASPASRSGENERTGFLSVVITSYNRFLNLTRSIPIYLAESVVAEVVIADDAMSTDSVQLLRWISESSLPAAQKAKLRIVPAGVRHGCYRNKVRAVQLARYEWVALLDSDNLADGRYWEPLMTYWRSTGETVPPSSLSGRRTIYSPESTVDGVQDFSNIMRETNGVGIDRTTWLSLLLHREALWAFLLCNYVVHRDVLRAWEPLVQFDTNLDPVGLDTLLLNHAAVRAGFRLLFVPDMTYEHGTSQDSLFARTVFEGVRVMDDIIHVLIEVSPLKDGMEMMPFPFSPKAEQPQLTDPTDRQGIAKRKIERTLKRHVLQGSQPYERLLSRWLQPLEARNSSFTLLHIGIGCGRSGAATPCSSCLLQTHVFTTAHVVNAEIDGNSTCFAECRSRCSVLVKGQHAAHVAELYREAHSDVVVDDGDRPIYTQLGLLLLILPHMSQGNLYFIEGLGSQPDTIDPFFGRMQMSDVLSEVTRLLLHAPLPPGPGTACGFAQLDDSLTGMSATRIAESIVVCVESMDCARGICVLQRNDIAAMSDKFRATSRLLDEAFTLYREQSRN